MPAESQPRKKTNDSTGRKRPAGRTTILWMRAQANDWRSDRSVPAVFLPVRFQLAAGCSAANGLACAVEESLFACLDSTNGPLLGLRLLDQRLLPNHNYNARIG